MYTGRQRFQEVEIDPFVPTGSRAGSWLSAGLAAALCACGPGPAPGPEKGPLRIALHGDPSTLDPHLHAEAIAHSVLGNVYESLVAFDSEMRLVPSLVERWESPDDLVWRFFLRPGVRFHDGRLLSAADVVFSIDRARFHPASKRSGTLVAITEARAVDDRVVEILTATPYPILLNKLAQLFIVPGDSPQEIRRPVGTGPYRFVSADEDRVLLEAFTEHWRGAPPESPVELLFISDPAERMRRLLAGELDFANELAPEDAETLAGWEDFRVESRSSLTVAYLQMNVTQEPFSDPRVRQAVDLALDRDTLVREILGGQAQPIGQMVSPNVFGYAPDLAPAARDLERARGLLAEAGFPNGFETTLELRKGREAGPIRDQLADAGIRVELVERPWSEMYLRLQAGQVGFYLGSWVCPPADASDFLDQKAHTRDLDRGYGSSNSNGYSDPDLDRLIEESGKRLDMRQRRDLLQQAMRLLAQDHAFVPLYTPYVLYGVRREIEWTPRQDEQVNAYEMRR